jgi:hypothetical protein
MVHFSKGYEDVNGQYVPQEYNHVNFLDVSFDPELYNQVKQTLYAMLDAHLNPQPE